MCLTKRAMETDGKGGWGRAIKKMLSRLASIGSRGGLRVAPLLKQQAITAQSGQTCRLLCQATGQKLGATESLWGGSDPFDLDPNVKDVELLHLDESSAEQTAQLSNVQTDQRHPGITSSVLSVNRVQKVGREPKCDAELTCDHRTRSPKADTSCATRPWSSPGT